MKRNLIRIGAGLLAAAFLAVGAAAAETALPADAKLAEPIPVIPEGMLRLPVTSSLAEDKSDLSVLFDGNTVGAEQHGFTVYGTRGILKVGDPDKFVSSEVHSASGFLYLANL